MSSIAFDTAADNNLNLPVRVNSELDLYGSFIETKPRIGRGSFGCGLADRRDSLRERVGGRAEELSRRRYRRQAKRERLDLAL